MADTLFQLVQRRGLCWNRGAAKLDLACRYYDELDKQHKKASTIASAIDELPDDLRTAITLRELEGLSYEEIAQTMDCPIGTVRSRIFRAREAIDNRLRPLINEKEDE